MQQRGGETKRLAKPSETKTVGDQSEGEVSKPFKNQGKSSIRKLIFYVFKFEGAYRPLWGHAKLPKNAPSECYGIRIEFRCSQLLAHLL